MSLPKWCGQTAINQFVKRALQARRTVRVENDRLKAGEPMYFYCEHCGIICDVLPEEYCFAPHRRCSQCEGLQEMCLVGEAKAALQEALSERP